MVIILQKVIVGNRHHALTAVAVRQVIDIEVVVILTTSILLDDVSLFSTVHICTFKEVISKSSIFC